MHIGQSVPLFKPTKIIMQGRKFNPKFEPHTLMDSASRLFVERIPLREAQ